MKGRREPLSLNISPLHPTLMALLRVAPLPPSLSLIALIIFSQLPTPVLFPEQLLPFSLAWSQLSLTHLFDPQYAVLLPAIVADNVSEFY